MPTRDMYKLMHRFNEFKDNHQEQHQKEHKRWATRAEVNRVWTQKAYCSCKGWKNPNKTDSFCNAAVRDYRRIMLDLTLARMWEPETNSYWINLDEDNPGHHLRDCPDAQKIHIARVSYVLANFKPYFERKHAIFLLELFHSQYEEKSKPEGDDSNVEKKAKSRIEEGAPTSSNPDNFPAQNSNTSANPDEFAARFPKFIFPSLQYYWEEQALWRKEEIAKRAARDAEIGIKTKAEDPDLDLDIMDMD